MLYELEQEQYLEEQQQEQQQQLEQQQHHQQQLEQQLEQQQQQEQEQQQQLEQEQEQQLEQQLEEQQAEYDELYDLEQQQESEDNFTPPSPSQPEQEAQQNITPRKTRLTNLERREICQLLQVNYNNGVLKRGLLTQIIKDFNLSRTALFNFWSKLKLDIIEGRVFDSNRAYKGGAPKHPIDLEAIRALDLDQRKTMRSISESLNCHSSAIRRLVKSGKLKSHTNAIKPYLTEQNKINRVKWCLGRVVVNQAFDAQVFHHMYNDIQIDEKLYYMSNASQRYYLLPDEIEPHRTCQSKKHITKIMFLAAVARPLYLPDGTCIFDGKIGIWPLIVEKPATNNSKNRPKGTMILQPIEKITREVMRDALINKLIPAIKAKWPHFVSKRIRIQQDNAKPHIKANDHDWLVAANTDGFEINLVQQPPNSPDLNVLDLGFFRAIQSLQHKTSSNTMKELIDAVVKAYNDIEPQKLRNVWLSLHYCMYEILKVKGGNNYKLPHVGKGRLERMGMLPSEVTISEQDIAEALEYVRQNEEL